MKTYKSIILIAALLFAGASNAQTINWSSLKEENKHLLNVNLGVEHGAIYGVGYGYRVKNKFFPFVANIEYSQPSGNNVLDDFKAKIGAQINWVTYHDFRFSTKIHGVFRRYENDFVRMLNFGSDLAGIAGYYRSRWFVAGEFGFDKSIVTHFKHSQMYREQYAAVVDGWYEPATGGNFYYGLQSGFTYKNYDLTLRVGKMATQDFKSTPLIPFYGQLGLNIRL